MMFVRIWHCSAHLHPNLNTHTRPTQTSRSDSLYPGTNILPPFSPVALQRITGTSSTRSVLLGPKRLSFALFYPSLTLAEEKHLLFHKNIAKHSMLNTIDDDRASYFCPKETKIHFQCLTSSQQDILKLKPLHPNGTCFPLSLPIVSIPLFWVSHSLSLCLFRQLMRNDGLFLPQSRRKRSFVLIKTFFFEFASNWNNIPLSTCSCRFFFSAFFLFGCVWISNSNTHTHRIFFGTYGNQFQV